MRGMSRTNFDPCTRAKSMTSPSPRPLSLQGRGEKEFDPTAAASNRSLRCRRRALGSDFDLPCRQRQGFPEDVRHRAGVEDAVHQIEQAAETGEEASGILFADVALDERFAQIADQTDEAENQA